MVQYIPLGLLKQGSFATAAAGSIVWPDYAVVKEMALLGKDGGKPVVVFIAGERATHGFKLGEEQISSDTGSWVEAVEFEVDPLSLETSFNNHALVLRDGGYAIQYLVGQAWQGKSLAFLTEKQEGTDFSQPTRAYTRWRIVLPIDGERIVLHSVGGEPTGDQ